MAEVVVEGGRGGAVEEVGVVGYLRRPCLSFCRICRGIQSRHCHKELHTFTTGMHTFMKTH